MSQVDEQRNPRTRATVNQMLDRHLEMLGVEETTLDSYESFVRNHIRPLIGDVAVGRINGEILDSFYRQLARCRTHCNRKRHTEHRTTEPHDCDERCKAHVCRPLLDGVAPEDPGDPERGGQAGGAMGVDRAQPLRARRADRSAAFRAASRRRQSRRPSSPPRRGAISTGA